MADLDGFLERLASGSPVPGGGSVAALHVAIGDALLCMVCELTLGRPAYASVEDDVEVIKGASTVGMRRARELVDEDAAAFERVSGAMKLPRTSDEEKSQRRRAMQESLKLAVQPPLETMRLAVDGVRESRRLVGIGNPAAISDVACAALAFGAGFSSARLNVDINLASIKDEAFVESIRRELAELPLVEGDVAAVVERAR